MTETMTLPIHFSVQKIPTKSSKPLPFSIQYNFYCSRFSLVFMTEFSLNLLSSMQHMSTDLHANISAI